MVFVKMQTVLVQHMVKIMFIHFPLQSSVNVTIIR